MNIKTLITAAISGLLLSGCSSFGIDGLFQNSQKLAADERMLLVTDKAVKRETKTGEIINAYYRAICAEPSPDAMTALGASGSLTGGFFSKVQRF